MSITLETPKPLMLSRTTRKGSSSERHADPGGLYVQVPRPTTPSYTGSLAHPHGQAGTLLGLSSDNFCSVK